MKEHLAATIPKRASVGETARLDTAIKLVAIKRAAESNDITFLVDHLLDQDTAVANGAFRSLLSAVPMASLPERWNDSSAPREACDENIPGWIVKSSSGWGEAGDFADLCVEKIKGLHGADLDRMLDIFAGLQGMHRILMRRLQDAGFKTVAWRFAKKAATARNKQYPKQICFAPTLACQLNCIYCISAGLEVDTANSISFDAAVSLLEWVKKTGVKRVCLSGGEPTIYPHFSELLSEMNKRDIEIVLATNGQGSPASTRAVIDAGVRDVTLHFTEELAENKRMDRFRRNASDLISAGIHVAMRYNFMSLNDDSRACLNTAHELGMKELRVAVPIPNVRRKNSFVNAGVLVEYGKVIGECLEYAQNMNIHVSIAKPFPLCMLSEKAAKNFLMDGSMLSNCQVRMQGYSHNIVVHTDLKFSPCLALNRKSKYSILDTSGVRSAASSYRGWVDGLMHEPLLDACKSCPLAIGGRCLGACLSYRE